MKLVSVSIIKWIALSIILYIIVTFWFECRNILDATLELTMLSNRAMQQSCEYFSQESFRGREGTTTEAGTVDRTVGIAFNLKNAANTTIISGDFYNSALGAQTQEEVYKALFLPSERPNDHLDYIINKLKDESNQSFLGYSSLETLEDIVIEQKYVTKEQKITPNNLGFTYLNSNVIKYIFTWFLANELTASSCCDSNDFRKRRNLLQQKDKYGIAESNNWWYAKWRGFRIYLVDDSLEPVSSVFFDRDDIEVLNIYDDTELFEERTSVKVKEHPFVYSSGGSKEEIPGYGYYIDSSGAETQKFKPNDLRKFKVIYRPKWHIQVAYEGILPLFFVRQLVSGRGEYNSLFSDGDPFESTDDDNVVFDLTKKPDTTAKSMMRDPETGNEMVTTDEDGSGLVKTKDMNQEHPMMFTQSLYYCIVH